MKEKEDYGQLFLPIQDFAENEDILFKLPHLRKYKEFEDLEGTPKGELNRDKVIRYVNLLYSSGSKLIRKHKHNLPARKEEAAIAAGFDLKKKAIREQVENDLFKIRNEKILKLIMRFLILQKNLLWTSIVTTESAYYEYQEIILDPLGKEDEKKRTDAAKNKSVLMDECDKMLIRLKGYYQEFFGDDIDLQLVYKDTELMLTSPEEIATIERRF
jgi:hypothetical protein